LNLEGLYVETESAVQPDRLEMIASWERRIAVPMVLLSLLFLGLLAGMLPQTPNEDELAHWNMAQVFFVPLGLLWSLFVLEFLVFAWFYGRRRTWKYHAYAFAVALAPPLRPSLRPACDLDRVYVPLMGWRESGKPLVKELQQYFSTPMMIVALMILPILGLEFLWTQWVDHYPLLLIVVEVGTRLIWLAFAIEFFIMIAVTQNKIGYCKDHWIDLAIILLPLVAFLRILRLARIGKLAKLQQMSRMYRLRGIFYRLLRATLLLEIVFRLNDRLAKARLEQLKGRLVALEEQAAEVRIQIAELEAELARRSVECVHPGGECPKRIDPVNSPKTMSD
jgi:voltage-gated potassium channel